MQDVILHVPEWLSNSQPRRADETRNIDVLFFVSGNPGLINYYRVFLSKLAEDAGRDAIVFGASLAGFETERSGALGEERRSEMEGKGGEFGFLMYPPSFKRKTIYDLQDQIELSEARLEYLVHWMKRVYPIMDGVPLRVVLLGHSVGAYIALEMVKRSSGSAQVHESTSKPSSSYFTVSTILLTPTIHDIAHSPSGKIATPILSTIPFFPALLQLGAGALASTLSETWLKSLVAKVTGMRDGDGLDTTVTFLRTPGAVNQALWTARCEMLEIGEADWKHDLWGIDKTDVAQDVISAQTEAHSPLRKEVSSPWQAPKHFFLFAQNDHWVAKMTRDAIIAKLSGIATVNSDEDGSLGLVHAWCLQQSDMVARIVNEWLKEALAT